MSNSELLFVVDEDDNPLDPLPRDEVIAKGLWRRTGGGMIIDKKLGKVLCQRRSENKDERPGVWSTLFGGKCDDGELPEDTTLRELQEEHGIIAKKQDLKFYTKYKADTRRQFEYLYLIYFDSTKYKASFDPMEVAEVAWKDINEAIKLLQNDPGWYEYGYDIEMLEQAL
ncbi:MAG: NUDIX domain-containing protein [Patescibacteria group bacterium]